MTTYNAHLFGRSLSLWRGWPRIGVFEDERRATEIAALLRREGREHDSDIVGLTEVWDRRLAERIVADVRDVYPYAIVGDAAARESRRSRRPVIGSGLVVLSKVKPLSGATFLRFAPTRLLLTRPLFVNLDVLSAKGALRFVVELDAGRRVVVYLVHLQADYLSRRLADERQRQVDVLATALQADTADSQTLGAVCMGDLNIIGDAPEYHALLQRLTLADAFRSCVAAEGGAPLPGYTYDAVANPLVTRFNPAASVRERLDYVLVAPETKGGRAQATDCELVAFADDRGLPLSDHFAVRAELAFSPREFE